jgi:hypothetical protein
MYRLCSNPNHLLIFLEYKIVTGTQYLIQLVNNGFHTLDKRLPALAGHNVWLISLRALSCVTLGAEDKCSYVLDRNQNHASKSQVSNLPKVMIHTTIT